MSGFRRFQAWLFNHELNPDNIRSHLSASAVPVSTSDCRTCSNPCEEGHTDYPARFKVDMETQMLGSVDPFRRQVLISTGKTDWDMEITWTTSLAGHIYWAYRKASVTRSVILDGDGKPVPRIAGIFNASDSTALSILNGSHHSIADDESLETVLVFPDFVVVAGVPSTLEGGQSLCTIALDPLRSRISGLAESPFSTWVLPYSCVITFCSHKRRDNRCGISAPLLQGAFIESLERRGWTVDTQLEHIIDPPLEKFRGTEEEKNAHITATLKTLQMANRALVLYNSHMGGHKYAGTCMIYTPNGSSVWYGRVTPHEVDSVVEDTIVGGLVLPPLLRGGMNLSKPGCKTLHDW
ncbi:Sucrase/ferredoxin-like-domain-containing protein [Mycena crocata]|nr:Sucrase/ferredoxin-like-domain-containing protein [Mycena crocata]